MDKEEMKTKMAELNEKMKKVGEKIKDGADTAYIIGLQAKDKLDDAIYETKCNVNALKENYQIYSKKVQGRAASELIKAQMNFDAAKKELQERKEQHDKEKLEKYIEETIEYAEACVLLSEIAIKEANLARLEAAKAQEEYNEKYGDK